MTRLLPIAMLCCAAVVCAFIPATAAQPAPFTATVVAVSDGDTFTARRVDGTLVKIRLHVVDAPEVAHRKSEVDQPYGGQARAFAEDQLQGEEVTVTPRGSSYGRIVGSVSYQGGDYALELLEHGYAWTDKRYRPTKEMVRLEAAARKESRGLWKGPSPPIEPRIWRKMTREQQRKHNP